MRVLIINTSESTGGAAIAAGRLVDALNHHGVKARMLVRDKQSSRVTTSAVPSTLRLRWAFLYERARIWVANRFRRDGIWAVDIACSGTDVTQTEEFREADIVHLHWVNQGYLSLRQIARILDSGKPVVWTLHDMWPVTGICHHAGDCDRYHTHCHDCPQLAGRGAHDLSWRVFRSKKALLAARRVHFVAVSQWMAQRARQSALLQGQTVSVIANTLPLSRFTMFDRAEARCTLGLPQQAHIIAFGAARIDQPVKGLCYLLEAIALLIAKGTCRREDIHLLFFGGCKDVSLWQRIPCPYTHLGMVDGEQRLSQVYSACDAVVSSSLYETFGQTVAEALASGCTPVAFAGSGQEDIIRHGENGFLADYLSIESLAEGLLWAFGAPVPREQLRHSVAHRFSEEAIAAKHIDLYNTLIHEKSQRA